MEGKTATRPGASRWVAGPAALRYAHHLRNIYDAILVGVSTVLIDNPKLNVRRVQKVKDPLRIILDSFARTPLNADVLKSPGGKTIIAVGPKAAGARIRGLARIGAEIIELSAPKGHIDVKALLKKLAEMKITSLLVEGGGEVNASFLEKGLIDKAIFCIAPKIFGGREAKTSVEGEGVKFPNQAIKLKKTHHEMMGEDFIISGYL